MFARQVNEEEARKGSAYQGSQGQQWSLDAGREVEAKWGLGHQELQGRWLRTHSRGGRGWDPTRAETQLRLPTSLRRVSHGLKTLPPENISGKRKAFIFQNSNSRALSLRTSPSALGPVWLASSQEVSPDPNMSMKESEDGGRWDRGD